jgi:hypothetical protein
MYHFTFIDEASTEIEKKDIKMQENNSKKQTTRTNRSQNLLLRTVRFLQKYVDQNNSVHIFINKE